SDWMAGLPEALWDIPLCHLAIPGSHDTMTFDLDATSSLEPSQPQILHTLLQVVPCITRPIIYSYSHTQDFGVSGQLDIGVRYFDLRIAHYEKDPAEILRYTHGFYTTLTVQVRKEFGCCVCKVVGDYTCSPLALESVLLVHASEKDGIFGFRPAVALWERGKCIVNNIIYLFVKGDGGYHTADGFFVAGMNLTPDSRYIIENLRGSIRQMTKGALPVVMEWLVQQTPGAASACVNVIGTDFTVPGVVSTIISLNWKLLQR
uniref:Zgc:112023 n=1 Tax=Petromyzon marinus TaxID=7757 RepID=S4RA09_PETMA